MGGGGVTADIAHVADQRQDNVVYDVGSDLFVEVSTSKHCFNFYNRLFFQIIARNFRNIVRYLYDFLKVSISLIKCLGHLISVASDNVYDSWKSSGKTHQFEYLLNFYLSKSIHIVKYNDNSVIWFSEDLLHPFSRLMNTLLTMIKESTNDRQDRRQKSDRPNEKQCN